MGNGITSLHSELHIRLLKDFQVLNSFCSGVESMDKFIRGDFHGGVGMLEISL